MQIIDFSLHHSARLGCFLVVERHFESAVELEKDGNSFDRKTSCREMEGGKYLMELATRTRRLTTNLIDLFATSLRRLRGLSSSTRSG